MKSTSLLKVLSLLGILFFSCSPQADKMFTLMPSSITGIDFRNPLKETEQFNVLNYGYLFLIKKIIIRLIIYFKNFLLKIISIDPSYYITPNEISYDELKEKKLNSKIFKYNSSLFNQFKKIAHQKSKKKISFLSIKS